MDLLSGDVIPPGQLRFERPSDITDAEEDHMTAKMQEAMEWTHFGNLWNRDWRRKCLFLERWCRRYCPCLRGAAVLQANFDVDAWPLYNVHETVED